jgi:hypothetical protein
MRAPPVGIRAQKPGNNILSFMKRKLSNKSTPPPKNEKSQSQGNKKRKTLNGLL